MADDIPKPSFSHSYQPLAEDKQQIRLLKLERSDSGPIRCTIDVFDLSSAPQYSAVSYRWGPRVFDHEVFVNEQSLKIGANLFHFLETFRRDKNEGHRYLWIDQICIAQSNIRERNHQVGLMSRIYSQSQLTIIWLCDDRGLYSVFAKDVVCTGKRSSLKHLLKDQYFKRLWIVQEILLSSDVWVMTNGNVWVPWKALRDCVTSTYSRWEDFSAWEALINPGYDFKEQFPRLAWCVQNFSIQDCDDPRDKVYGLLGLAHEDLSISIDYSKSTLEVYLDALLAADTDKRTELGRVLGRGMGISAQQIRSLLAFLDLVRPVGPELREEQDRLVFLRTLAAGRVTSIGVLWEDQNFIGSMAAEDERSENSRPQALRSAPLLVTAVSQNHDMPQMNPSKTAKIGRAKYPEDELGPSYLEKRGRPSLEAVDSALNFKYRHPETVHDFQDEPANDTGDESVNGLGAEATKHPEGESSTDRPFDFSVTSDRFDSGTNVDLDLGQSILDFHLRVHQNAKTGPFGRQDWQTQADILDGPFWSYVRETAETDQPDPKKTIVGRWCYECEGRIYRYSKLPKWEAILRLRPDTVLIDYIMDACSKSPYVLRSHYGGALSTRTVQRIQESRNAIRATRRLCLSDCQDTVDRARCWAQCRIDTHSLKLPSMKSSTSAHFDPTEFESGKPAAEDVYPLGPDSDEDAASDYMASDIVAFGNVPLGNVHYVIPNDFDFGVEYSDQPDSDDDIFSDDVPSDDMASDDEWENGSTSDVESLSEMLSEMLNPIY